MKDKEFESVVKQYEKLVFTVCYKLVHDYQEAENLTQETFLSAYRHIDDYHGDSYKPWLIRIASNKAKDFLKSAWHRKVDTSDEMEGKIVVIEPSAEELTLSRETVARLREEILGLKEPYRNAAILFFLNEKTVDEIAFSLGRPKKTVQTQLYRAKLKLQKSILEGGIGR